MQHLLQNETFQWAKESSSKLNSNNDNIKDLENEPVLHDYVKITT